MKQLACLLSIAVCMSACAKKQEQAPAGQASGLPKGLALVFTPKNMTVNAGQKLRGKVEKTSWDEYKYEWAGTGECGELKVVSKTAHEIDYVGGAHGKECKENVTFKATGKPGTFQTTFTVTVKATAALAELVVRPEPLPDSWVMINDYDATQEPQEVKCTYTVGGKKRAAGGNFAFGADKKKVGGEGEAPAAAGPEAGDAPQEITDIFDGITLNRMAAPFSTWKFEFAGCHFADPPAAEKGVLAMQYDLPHNDSYCGYFETLAMGKDCQAAPGDVSAYDRVTFIVKSGDGKPHRVFVELVGWEKYAEFHQGTTMVMGPYDVPADAWKRYEVPLSELIKDTLLASSIKSVSFKVTRDKQPDQGVILFDNVAFIKKAAK